MMQRHGIKFRTTCQTAFVLAKVRENREKHAQMVQEARAGYLKQAEAELSRRLGAIREGKVVPLSFQLQVPHDFTSMYDTTIAMLAAHQDATVVLEADEFRNMVEDQWDWTNQFALVNAVYSDGTRHWAVGKGVDFGFAGSAL